MAPFRIVHWILLLSLICLTVQYDHRKLQYNIINPTPYIVGGIPAIENQLPWQVLLLSQVGQMTISCGGSIIGSNWVITAAHCLDKFNQVTIKFGTITRNSAKDIMTSVKWIIHPDYNSNNYQNDIALVELPRRLIFSDAIQPIKIIPRSIASSNIAGIMGIVSGFGFTSDSWPIVSEQLMLAYVEIITNKACHNFYGDYYIFDTTICAKGFNNINQGACNGDSGGPLSILYKNRYILVGITSFVSVEGCEAGIPSGYTRIGSFLGWISLNTGIDIET